MLAKTLIFRALVYRHQLLLAGIFLSESEMYYHPYSLLQNQECVASMCLTMFVLRCVHDTALIDYSSDNVLVKGRLKCCCYTKASKLFFLLIFDQVCVKYFYYCCLGGVFFLSRPFVFICLFWFCLFAGVFCMELYKSEIMKEAGTCQLQLVTLHFDFWSNLAEV